MKLIPERVQHFKEHFTEIQFLETDRIKEMFFDLFEFDDVKLENILRIDILNEGKRYKFNDSQYSHSDVEEIIDFHDEGCDIQSNNLTWEKLRQICKDPVISKAISEKFERELLQKSLEENKK